jgi:hypothetical protein
METAKTRTKAFLYTQFSPAKTLSQLIEDHNLYHTFIHVAPVVVLFV